MSADLMTKSIGLLLAAVMAEVDAVGKNRRNEAQRYAFRGIDDFMNALHPVLAKHGVVLRPHVVECKHLDAHETKNGGLMFRVSVTMDTAFCAPDGSTHVVRTVGEGADTGDKATNKAMSAALKYALVMTFLVPTEERSLVDSEEDSHEARRPKGPRRVPARRQAQESGPPPGAEAEDLRERIAALLPQVPPAKRAAVEKSLAAVGDNVARLRAGLAFVKGCVDESEAVQEPTT